MGRRIGLQEDELYKDAMETEDDSRDPNLAENLMRHTKKSLNEVTRTITKLQKKFLQENISKENFFFPENNENQSNHSSKSHQRFNQLY